MGGTDIDITQLDGSWNLVSWRHIADDGEVTAPYSPAATGRIIFDVPNLRMCGFLMHPDWPASDGEQRLFLSYSASMELHGDTLLHRVDFASNPRMIGETLRRRVKLDGDTLTLETLVTVGRSGQSGRHILVWRRN